tara:strand:+ start:504 stop:737 length:234 start_codon:yes stop_codon:yes gene_type:complete
MRKIKTKVGKRVEVEWLDITADINTDAAIEPEHSFTVGWIEFENKIYIRLLTSKYKSLDIADKIAIPKGCIISIKEI